MRGGESSAHEMWDIYTVFTVWVQLHVHVHTNVYTLTYLEVGGNLEGGSEHLVVSRRHQFQQSQQVRYTVTLQTP